MLPMNIKIMITVVIPSSARPQILSISAQMLKITVIASIITPSTVTICIGAVEYAEILEILQKKRKSADDKERLEWYCIDGDYDPNEFDIDFHQALLDESWEEATSYN